MTTATLTKEEQEVLEVNEAVEESLKTKVTFKIHTPLLQSLISQVERSAAKLAVVDIMKGIYIHVANEQLTLRALNNEFGTEITVAQEDIVDGKKKIKNFEITEGNAGGFVVLQKNFKAMINKLPRNIATISVDGTQALIKSGSTKYNLMVLDTTEFPAFPEVKGSALDLSPDQLLEAYDKTSYAISTKSNSKPVLTGLNHRIENNKLFFIATDGHQLSRVAFDLDEDVKVGDLNFTLPQKSVDEIRKQARNSKTVSIHVGASNVIFEFDTVTMFSRVFNEKYPDTSKMVPTEFTTEIRFSAKDLKDMIERSILLYEGDTTTASLRSIPELRQMRISSFEDGVGFFEEDLGATEGAGAPIHIGVNLRFLLEAIKVHSPGDLLKVQFLSGVKPFLISRADQEVDDNINLVLPVRLQAYDKEVTIENFNAPVQIEAAYEYELDDDATENVVEETKEVVPNEVQTEEVITTEETTVEDSADKSELPPAIQEEVEKISKNPFANLVAANTEEERQEIPVDPNQQNAFVQED